MKGNISKIIAEFINAKNIIKYVYIYFLKKSSSPRKLSMKTKLTIIPITYNKDLNKEM